jgi:hypothetical protein
MHAMPGLPILHSRDLVNWRISLCRSVGRRGKWPFLFRKLAAIDPDESTKEAIGDWHYWVSQGCIL